MGASADQLFRLLRQGDLEQLTKLLNEDNINAKSSWCESLLHEAVTWAGQDAVRMLIDCGIDVNLRNDNGNTPLLYATSGGKYDIAKMLLEAGADPNIKGNKGMTPLRSAITNPLEEFRMVKLCLEHGGDPWIENHFGSSTVHYAEKVHPDFAEYLKQFGHKSEKPRGSELFQQLSARLLKIGGKSVQEGLPDAELRSLLDRGELFPLDGLVVRRRRVGECHHNVAEKYCQAKYRKAEIATGHALSDGIWFLHSWLVLKGQIVETTLRFGSYFGYRLTHDESVAFVKSTRPDLGEKAQNRASQG